MSKLELVADQVSPTKQTSNIQNPIQSFTVTQSSSGTPNKPFGVRQEADQYLVWQFARSLWSQPDQL